MLGEALDWLGRQDPTTVFVGAGCALFIVCYLIARWEKES